MTSVVCAECRHENEPERVFCHHCGARLDRSAVKVRRDDVVEQRKRVKKLFDPQRARIKAAFLQISKLLIGAAVVAAIVELFMPPDLPAPAKSGVLASQIRLELEHAVSHPQATPLSYTQDQVNDFLTYSLKTKAKTLNEPLLDFRRAVVHFQEGQCTVTMERALSGYYSLYTSYSFMPTVEGGKIHLKVKGGHIGRMPIHPQLARFMGYLFLDLESALDTDTRLVAKMTTIEVHDKAVVLSTVR
jgi:hypothetical protein